MLNPDRLSEVPLVKLVKSISAGEPYQHVQALEEQTQGPYHGTQAKPNKWMVMACEEAKKSVEEGGGPFGAVLLQVGDETGTVIRFWRDHNRVTEQCDPTAHAETMVIRAACRELGTCDLSNIADDPEPSHCELYSSCEPCPMCYGAIVWARIPVLVFSATRADASDPEVGFSDEHIHSELKKDYQDRSVRVYNASCGNAKDAFEMWKRSGNKRY
jgi:tRNA(Arg) A34 adenosine deaminase TadA